MGSTNLTQQVLRSLVFYDPESGDFTWLPRSGVSKHWWNGRYAGKKIVGYIRRDGYVAIDFMVDGIRHKWSAHRLAWLYVCGDLSNFQIDHINRVKTDNRISNLRLATPSQNTHNATAHKRSKTGIKGVYWDKSRQKWHVEIVRMNKKKHLGRFDSIEEATAVYATASVEYAKEFSIFSQAA